MHRLLTNNKFSMQYFIKQIEFNGTQLKVVVNGKAHYPLDEISEIIFFAPNEKLKRNFKDWIRSNGSHYLKVGRKNYYSISVISKIIQSKSRMIKNKYENQSESVDKFLSVTLDLENRAMSGDKGQQLYDVKEIEVSAKQPTEPEEVLKLKEALNKSLISIEKLSEECLVKNEAIETLETEVTEFKNKILVLESNIEKIKSDHEKDILDTHTEYEEEISKLSNKIKSFKKVTKIEKIIRQRLMSDNIYLVATVILISCLLPFSISAFMEYASFAKELNSFFDYVKYGISLIMAIALCGGWDFSILIFALNGSKIKIFGKKTMVSDIGTFFQTVFISVHFNFIKNITGSDRAQMLVVVGCIIFYTAFLVNQLSKLSKKSD